MIKTHKKRSSMSTHLSTIDIKMCESIINNLIQDYEDIDLSIIKDIFSEKLYPFIKQAAQSGDKLTFIPEEKLADERIILCRFTIRNKSIFAERSIVSHNGAIDCFISYHRDKANKRIKVTITKDQTENYINLNNHDIIGYTYDCHTVIPIHKEDVNKLEVTNYKNW